MKTINQINHARDILKRRVMTPGMTDAQTALLGGMLQSLVWVADGANCSTMERLLAGEEIAAGKDSAEAMLTFALMREAPELLAALKETLDALFNETHGQADSPWIQTVKARAAAAIAKATGET